MSSFICEKCGATCLETLKGYITGCEHYPIDIECKFLTCGWMCGQIFINSGLERECNPYENKSCIMSYSLDK